MTPGRIALVICFLVALAPLVTFPSGDPDLSYHLATGRWIATHRAIPHADPFSQTAAGRPWITHEWLFQLGLYGIERLGGLTLIQLVRIATVIAALGLLAALAIRRGVPLPVVLGSLLIVAWTGADRFVARPQIATMLLLAAFLVILLDNRDGRSDRLRWLPPLMLVWVNLHSLFIAGLGVLGVFWLEALLLRRANRRRLGFVLAACFLVSFVNPNFHEVHGYFFKPLLSALTSGSNRVSDFTPVAEFRPITHPVFRTWTFFPLFWVLLVVGLGALVLRRAWTRRAIAETVIFLGLGAATIAASRNHLPFAIVAFPVITSAFAADIGDTSRRLARWRLRLQSRGSHFAAAAILAGVAAASWIPGPRLVAGYHRPIGFGWDDQIPAPATAFVRSAGVAGNVLNEMRFGGWLMWDLGPERKVFIDGRTPLYAGDLFREYVALLGHAPGFDARCRARGIEWCFLRNSAWPPPPADPYPPLARALSADDRWALVWFDDVVVLFVRRDGPNAGLAARWAYRSIDPFTESGLVDGVDPQEDRDRVLAEVARLRAVPGHRTGLLADRVEAMALGTERPRELMKRARRFLEEGRWDEARPLLERCVARDSTLADAWNDLGVAEAQAGHRDRARIHWEKAVSIEPRHPGARDNLRRLDATGDDR